MRWLRHLLDFGLARRRFPPAVMDAIQRAIAASEQGHAGEIVFAVEGSLSPGPLWRGEGARQRAQAVFAQLRVWDTHANSGVLIYVLLAEHAVEIVADRGAAAVIGADAWQGVCALMQQHFADGAYERGAVAGIQAVGALLAPHFPVGSAGNPDELSDRPVLL
ncbi:TPM domain-containing protein [Dokdonella sp.]|uniref:TPM domain-containing protein n=1 Tax=Dokdonella sp. TaxID=2291710 RepID=UPI0031BE7502|nr:TPM domain-containing protein [Dokdonella sp.]